MKKIVFVKACSINNTRLLKMAHFLSDHGFQNHFIGWDRENENELKSAFFSKITYICKGGGFGDGKMSKLIFYYLIFQAKLFFYLFKIDRRLNDTVFFAVNFDVAIVVYFFSLFKPSIKYYYEIRDEFSKTYKVPSLILPLLNFLEKKIRKRAITTIHVDENRVDKADKNYLVINNSPFDFYVGKTYHPTFSRSFAVTGYLNETRGILEILKFAQDNSDYIFIVIGRFIRHEFKEKFQQCKNVRVYGYQPQEDVFKLISSCRGIFSLYDPTLEINRLAASNKLYDAMMLGIPVIVNNEILASSFVKKNDIGFCIDYSYNKSWDILTKSSLSEFKEKGQNGRRLYMTSFEFSSQLAQRLLPSLKRVFE